MVCGQSVDRIYDTTNIDETFVHHIQLIERFVHILLLCWTQFAGSISHYFLCAIG